MLEFKLEITKAEYKSHIELTREAPYLIRKMISIG